MRIAIGADHAGFELKAPVEMALASWGHDVLSLGIFSPEPVDFPDVVVPVCEAVLAGEADRGILVCGTGIGACMAANKVPGIRAALCHDVHSAHQSVEHDDANVACLGAKIVGEWIALDLIRTFLDATFKGEEHFQRRIDKMTSLENRPRHR
ncbi:ribose 5-phosphate isomerase B [soil metagenome]